MRTIKSQDGKMIVNAEKLLSFSVRKSGMGKGYSVIADPWTYDESWLTLGLYSTEKRALRALDTLNEWICAKLVDPHDGTWEPEQAEVYRMYQCLQMPQDGVEAEA